jgi:O-antigen ligase
MRQKSENWIFALTVGSAAAVLLSIAAAQILLVAALALWLATRPVHFRWPSYFLPLAAFMAATLLSMVMSPDARPGIWALRKFWLFSMGLLASHFVSSERRAVIAMRVLVAAGGLASLIGVVEFPFFYKRFLQTGLLKYDPMVLDRITGTMGHPMTFSGEQLLVWCAAVPALAVLGWKWALPISITAAALVLGFTRSVWIGATAGILAVGRFVPRRALIMVMAPLLIVGVAASPLIYHRISMSFGPQFAPDTSRIAMYEVGSRMIQDRPLFGVGPERIHEEFPRYYRGADLDTAVPYYGHLHNNVLQIAAERGLLCLATFFWLLLELYRNLIMTAKASDVGNRWIPLSAIAALTGFVVAGLFEYNFGDSEVLLLLLFIVSMPFGRRTSSRPDGGPDASAMNRHVQENPDLQPG